MEDFSYYGQRTLPELMRLDLRYLKSAARDPVGLHPKRQENIRFLKENCPDFVLDGVIGICKRIKIVCPSWWCDFLSICKNNCIKECPAKNNKAITYNKPPTEMNSTLKLCNSKIDKISEELPAEEVIGYMIIVLEKLAAEALTTAPSELISIMKIRDWLFNKYGDLRKFRFQYSKSNELKLRELWHLFITRFILESNIIPLERGDIRLLLTPKGQENLTSLAKDPLFDIKRFIEFYQKVTSLQNAEAMPPSLCKRPQIQIWTRKMVRVLEWCARNDLNPRPGGESFTERIKQIINHVAEVGTNLHLNPSECLQLGIPHYTTLYYTLRYCRFKFPWLVDVLNSYKGLKNDSSALKSKNYLPWNWDSFIANIPWPGNDPLGRLFDPFKPSEDLKIEQSPIWPIDDGIHSLNWSILLLGFALKNEDEIVTIPNITGTWFEEVLVKELESRRIPIVDRGIQLPDPYGDIDILAFDEIWYYVIEAKDWGPRSKKAYFSSAEYQEREVEMQEDIGKLVRRLEWLEGNRESIGLPLNSKLIGLFVTAFEEPHISVPDEIIHVPHHRLCGIFGDIPVNPVFSAKNLDINIKFKQEKGDINGGKEENKYYEQISTVELNEEDNKKRNFALERIIEIFGSINASHVYRVIYEISEAIKNQGFGIKEICAQPHGRPPVLTKQYLMYIMYRGDGLTFNKIESALNNLNQKKLILVREEIIELLNVPSTEFWQLINGTLEKVQDRNNADIIINDRMSTIEKGITIIGMTPPLIKFSSGFSIIDIREG